MGELWLTFFTPDSHAAKRRYRRHLIDAAAEIFDRRAAAAGQNHPARRRRKNDVGAELYCHTIFLTNCMPINTLQPGNVPWLVSP